MNTQTVHLEGQDSNQHFDWSPNQASDCSYQRALLI